MPLTSLLAEIENAIANRSGETGRMLRHITDLFLLHVGHYSPAQLAIYDDVLKKLVENVDIVVRAKLAERIATVQNVPPNTVRLLALDGAIEVARPVLAHSSLDDGTLIESINSNGQPHLIAIAGRRQVSEPVSDQLVRKGNNEVLGTLAGNPGAAISSTSYDLLLQKSISDDWLMERVGLRSDIPPQLFRELISKASDIVRQRLMEKNPDKREIIEEIFAESELAEAHDEPTPKDYRTAELMVESRPLNEAAVHAFAKAGRIEEVIVSMSRLSAVPVTDIERLILGPWGTPVVVLFRAVGFRLATFEAVYKARPSGNPNKGEDELAQAKGEFVGLTRPTAERILRFYTTRRKVEVTEPLQPF